MTKRATEISIIEETETERKRERELFSHIIIRIIGEFLKDLQSELLCAHVPHWEIMGGNTAGWCLGEMQKRRT